MKRYFFLKIIHFMAMCYSGLIYAEPDGVCWTDPTHIINIDMMNGTVHGNGSAGTTVTGTWMLSNRYYTAQCTSSNGHYLDAYTGTVSGAIPYTGNELHVTSGVDIKIGVSTTNCSSPIGYLPFSIDTNVYSGGDISYGGTLNTMYGSCGPFTITVNKDTIGGVILIPPVYLGSFYYSVSTSPIASKSMIDYYSAATIIPVPTVCNINNGNIIDVDPGSLRSDKLTMDAQSATYRKTQQLSYNCSNSLTKDIAIAFIGDAATFDATGKTLATSSSQIGIQMLAPNGEVISPNTTFASRLVNGQGSDTVTFVPVKNPGTTPTGGAFSASATLIITQP